MPSSSKNNLYTTYLSPFTTRYGSAPMRRIWSEEHKRLLWRNLWVSLAKAQHKAGIVSKEELADIVSHEKDIDIDESWKIEKEIYHELMAEITLFSQQCKIGGGKIHVGATSTDILDNTTIVQVHQSLTLIEKGLRELLQLFAEKIQEHENLVCMGYTHLQPAEPTTMGYRFAFYAQDICMDLEFLEKIKPMVKGKGIKGAVGTSASYETLLQNTPVNAFDIEQSVMKDLGIESIAITTQTYPRKIDLLAVELLANISASLSKFAFDFRILQSPGFGEWMEKRSTKRVGSSAMPFKKNPDKAEKVCSLAKFVNSQLTAAWSNPANSLLERTLDDSANQRIFLPETFLATDEMIQTTKTLLEKLAINTVVVAKNLSLYGQFAATEPLLMQLVKNGANRQKMHEIIKSCSMKVWQGREEGKTLSVFDLLSKEKEIRSFISKEKIQHMSSPSSHIGLAKKLTRKFLQSLQKYL